MTSPMRSPSKLVTSSLKVETLGVVGRHRPRDVEAQHDVAVAGLRPLDRRVDPDAPHRGAQRRRGASRWRRPAMRMRCRGLGGTPAAVKAGVAGRRGVAAAMGEEAVPATSPSATSRPTRRGRPETEVEGGQLHRPTTCSATSPAPARVSVSRGPNSPGSAARRTCDTGVSRWPVAVSSVRVMVGAWMPDTSCTK